MRSQIEFSLKTFSKAIEQLKDEKFTKDIILEYLNLFKLDLEYRNQWDKLYRKEIDKKDLEKELYSYKDRLLTAKEHYRQVIKEAGICNDR